MKSKFIIIGSALLVLSLISGLAGGVLAVKYYPELIGNLLDYLTPNNSLPAEKKEISTPEETAVIDAVDKALPSVVSVILTRDVPIYEKYWKTPFEFLPEFQVPEYEQKGTEKQQIGGGSGLIISADGMILTNKHVVEVSDVEYTVILDNGEKYPAKILAKDPIQDLAIIKIEKNGLIPLELGDSDNLKLGQTVIAIGYALGEFENTVSVGVVSGLKRSIAAGSSAGKSELIEEVIQTDTAINPGNSGGPLLDLSGKVIGVNVAVASGAENIGFAIPVNKAKRAIEEVKTKGKITYPFLGVRYSLIDEDVQKEYNLPVDYGAWVIKGEAPEQAAITLGSAADKAGIKENDIILEFNGEKITKENTLAKLILKYKAGDKVKIKFLREGKEIEVEAELGER